MPSVEQSVTMLFARLHNFAPPTSTARFRVLNDYHASMDEVIKAHDATVHEFLADGIAARFVTTSPDAGANEAVNAAIAMQGTLAKRNRTRAKRGELDLKLTQGVALHAGPTSNAGHIAARIERLSARYGAALVVTAQTRARFVANDVGMREIGDVRARDMDETFAIYEVLDGEPDEDVRKAKLASRATYDMARRMFISRDFEQALRQFEELAEAHPDDALFKVYVKRAAAWVNVAKTDANADAHKVDVVDE